jgi:hypothetical protein
MHARIRTGISAISPLWRYNDERMKLPPGVSKEKFERILRRLLTSSPMPLSSISPKPKSARRAKKRG